MKKVLDYFGSFFVYKSPDPYDGYAWGLKFYPNWYLKGLAGTKKDLNKTELIKLIVDRVKRIDV